MSTVEATEPKTNSTAIAKSETKALVPVFAGQRGLELRSIDDMWRFAKAVSESGLAPKGIESPAAVFVALQMGAELGLTPMASLQNIAVINGRPSVWGDAMLAVCRASGVFDEEAFDETISGDGQKLTATCTVRRLPRGKPITRTFSMDDAKQASLQGKAGPWTQYPRRMLQMRSRSWALRDGFADVLRGFRCAEEAFDIIDVDSAPVGNPHARVRKSDLDAPEKAQAPLPEADPRLHLAAVQLEIAEAVTIGKLNEINDRERHEQVRQWCEMRREEIRSSRGGKPKQESLDLGGPENTP